MSIIHIAGYMKHSFVDGEGIRFALFTQGCPHACPFCHNPGTWNIEGGMRMETSALIDEIRAAKYIDGVTISGGDPLMQPEQVLEIVRAVKKMNLNVWLYTGWTYEALLAGAVPHIDEMTARELLNYIDVLIDGRFIVSRAYDDTTDENGTPYYRGSANQRLIDCKASLAAGRCVLYAPQQALKIAN